MYAGIDPGKTGAVAWITEDGQADGILDINVGPVVGKVALVALEQVHSMPKQGVASSFKFGTEFGYWKGWLTALGIPYVLVTPRRWQKAVLDAIPRKGNIKDTVWQFARRRWPDADLTGPRGAKLYGRADALCLAEYARLTALRDLARGGE